MIPGRNPHVAKAGLLLYDSFMIQETRYHVNMPCSVALLADLHNRPCQVILASLKANAPDIICFAGDIVDGEVQNSLSNELNSLTLLEECPAIAPTFLSIGNHDWILTPDDFEQIRAFGIQVLDNGYTSWNGIHIGGLTSAITMKVRLYGWDFLPSGRAPEFGYPDLDWLDEFEQEPGPRILLCHHPEYYPDYLASRHIEYVLSGHAHGGQWSFFGRGIYAPGQGFLPKLTSGIHDRMIISRGLANTCGIIPRINNPTEIVYLD